MKTAISIPGPIFEEAELLAEKLKISRSELYSRAVKKFVEEQREWSVTEALNEVYSKESSNVEPVLAALQRASLPEEEW